MKNNQYDVVIMITAIDRPELHFDVFTKYLEYTKGVNCKWVITINNVTGRVNETVDMINTVFKNRDVHVKPFKSGGRYNDWHESVKYCINYAYSFQPTLGYVWLEDDWLLVTKDTLLEDLKLLDHDICYIALHNREHVSFNPGVWSHGAFNELMYNSINNPESSLGASSYKAYYIDKNQSNPERLCCSHPNSTNFIKSYKRVTSRFKDVGRSWTGQVATADTRTYNINDKV
jgi:hypothetical protein